MTFPAQRRWRRATRDDARCGRSPKGLRGRRSSDGPSRTPLARLASAVAALAVATFAVTSDARADDAADARKHAQRASSLAASGKCRQAVAEFDKALAVLRDPALLFNRGECHRKLGDAEAAVDDYKQFLSDLPKAPNRAEVERRIAELSKRSRAPSGGAAAPPVPPAPVAERPVREPPSTSKRESGDARAAGTTGGSVAPRPAAPPAAPVIEPEPPGVREVDLTAPPPAPATAAASEGTSLSSRPESESRSEPTAEGGLAAKPWFWVAVGAVVVGAGVGAFLLLSHDSTKVPSSALGNYQF